MDNCHRITRRITLRPVSKPLAAALIALALLAAGCSGPSAQVEPASPAIPSAPSQTPAQPPALAETALPRSIKGYELYSWQADGGWSFTLIMGTNRSKTAEEITSGENLVSGDGWVKITVQGVEAIKTVLDRLPAGESIFWIGSPGSGPAPAEWDSLALPHEEIVAELQEHCRDLGLELQVSAGPAAAADTENGPPTPAAPVETSGPSEPGPSLPTPTTQPADAEASPPTQRQAPLELPAGLTVEEHALKNRPQVEPLAFDPVQGSQTGILKKHSLERGAHFPNNSFFAGGRYAMRVKLGEAELVAAEEFDRTGSQGWVTLWQGEKEIYRIDTMPGSPINALRGLWVYDGHWVLETAAITSRQEGDAVSNNVVGQISQDGELLNTHYGYEEMFGFQTMAGKPFYFFKQDGKIGFSYDGQVVHAGYDEIPHYGCCSAGALNPVRATNMVAFSAQREGVWYYVEIGVYAADQTHGVSETPWVLKDSQSSDTSHTYTDPAGGFSLQIPPGWRPGAEAGAFAGPSGSFRAGYLPEMAFMDRAYRVCEWLANTGPGPARKVTFSPLPDLEDACLLAPYPEMSAGLPMLVVANPAGEPEQRYIYLEADPGHFETLATSLRLLNPPDEPEAFPHPAGPLRPQDLAFWGQVFRQPGELTLEEYAVVEASVDSPTHFEFKERIPDEVFQKRQPWRGGFWERRLAGSNALLEPFGYSLQVKEGSEMDLYELYRGEELILDDLNSFWPVSVSASGSDFALLVDVRNGGFQLVRKDSLEDWEMSAGLYGAPVFHGESLFRVGWDSERSQVQVLQGEEALYTFSTAYLVGPPAKGLWSWQGHWLLEVDGFLIQDGESLNERLGFEESFGWQLLNGKPFYYFRKGPRVGISYDDQVLPVYYEDIIHYRCCEPAAFNNGGNEDMVWFYGLRDGVWYYVEIGVYA